MDKITEALTKVLPVEQVETVKEALQAMVDEQVASLEESYKAKLEEAYTEVSKEKEAVQQVAEQGYQQAYEIIADLMKQKEAQREEFEAALEEGFDEAYQDLQKEKAKNENIEVELYEEFDKKLKQMMEFMVDKVDQFLALQEQEIYEHAKKDILCDPRLAEQRLIVNKMAEMLSSYMDSDDLNAVASSKIEESQKAVEELKGQIRILETKNLRLNTTNTKLAEQVEQAKGLLSEATKVEKKERAKTASNVSGRGQRVVTESIVVEQGPGSTASEVESVTEGVDAQAAANIILLSGL